MSRNLIVFGYIDSLGYPENGWINDYNKKVIDELPEYGLLGITRSMFTVLPMNRSADLLPMEQRYPQNEIQLITFAASYIGGSSLSQEWIDQFEDLLTRLYWNHTTAIVDAMGLMFQYNWGNDDSCFTLPPSKEKWRRSAYELWHRVEIPWEQAIDYEDL